MTAIEQLQHIWLSEALRNPSKNLLCEASRVRGHFPMLLYVKTI